MLLKEIKYTYYCNDLRFWDNINTSFCLNLPNRNDLN